MADDKILVSQLYEKNNQDELKGPIDIGVTFANVIDEYSNYSLAQFFRNYLDFMQTTTFVHTGKVAPVNNHIGLWIDTNETNKDEIGWTEDTDFKRIIDVFNTDNDDFGYTSDNGANSESYNRVIKLFLDEEDNITFVYEDGEDVGYNCVKKIDLEESGNLVYTYDDGK